VIGHGHRHGPAFFGVRHQVFYLRSARQHRKLGVAVQVHKAFYRGLGGGGAASGGAFGFGCSGFGSQGFVGLGIETDERDGGGIGCFECRDAGRIEAHALGGDDLQAYQLEETAGGGFHVGRGIVCLGKGLAKQLLVQFGEGRPFELAAFAPGQGAKIGRRIFGIYRRQLHQTGG